jgi:PIN domain nuclease of toxin-antitoxin system
MSYVLDASALIALALGEPGSGVVAKFAQNALVSTVNVSEFLQRLRDKGIPEEQALHQLARFEIDIVPFGLDHAQLAAKLRPATKHLGLSLGDRACLSLALARDRHVLTADHRMAEADIGLDIRMIR